MRKQINCGNLFFEFDEVSRGTCPCPWRASPRGRSLARPRGGLACLEQRCASALWTSAAKRRLVSKRGAPGQGVIAPQLKSCSRSLHAEWGGRTVFAMSDNWESRGGLCLNSLNGSQLLQASTSGQHVAGVERQRRASWRWPRSTYLLGAFVQFWPTLRMRTIAITVCR